MAKKKAAKSKEVLCVGSKVKEHIRSKDMMCSADVLEAVNDCIHGCLDRAVCRAEANGRKTVQARDL
jgi:histone H3/H4